MMAINWTQYVRDHLAENQYELLGLCSFGLTSTFTIWFIFLPYLEEKTIFFHQNNKNDQKKTPVGRLLPSVNLWGWE